MDLLNGGLMWRVGDGKNIKIWEDRWIPKAVTFKIQSPVNILNAWTRVEEWIVVNREWNEELVK